jgi:hypothetical protein
MVGGESARDARRRMTRRLAEGATSRASWSRRKSSFQASKHLAPGRWVTERTLAGQPLHGGEPVDGEAREKVGLLVGREQVNPFCLALRFLEGPTSRMLSFRPHYRARLGMTAHPASRLWPLAIVIFGVLAPKAALADRSTIKFPNLHPSYAFEAEPHIFFTPRLRGAAPDGLGAGFRGTFTLVDNGFVKTINNSVGLGLGVDTNLSGERSLWFPIAMQWNFGFTERWSLFGEAGGTLLIGPDKLSPHPGIAVGGRYLFSRKVALTLRGGLPSIGVGISFFL